MNNKFFLLTGFLTGVFTMVHAQAAPTKKVYTYTGIKGQEQKMEVYLPDGHKPSDKRPCFIFFHGGGWKSGVLNEGRPLCTYLASRGIVTLTASYSMHPDAKKAALSDPDAINEPLKLPEGESRKRICVIDGKTVIRWAKKNADELGIDPDRIITSGASAGGHIAVLQMMDDQFNNPNDPEEVDTTVQAFVLLCPAFTLPKKDKVPDVNVFQYVDKKFPPTLFIVGEKDFWLKASNPLAEQLIEKNNDVEVWMAHGAGHMFHRQKNWYPTTKIMVDRFLVDHGFLEGQSPLEPVSDEFELKPVQF